MRMGFRSLALRGGLAGRAVLERADQLAAAVAPKDRAGLLVFVFHCVFADDQEPDSGLIDPHERATPAALRRLFDHFRGHGYRFVSAAEIDRGLAGGGLYAHLTFDDGFANNLRLLDLLPSEEVHATIFPSAHHVRDGKAYWWNVVYRERHRRGQQASIAAEYGRLRQMTPAEIGPYLASEFGPDALTPAGDLDRPLAMAELRELGASPWVEIGNHTLDHAVLPRCSRAQQQEQIAGAQRWLAETLGEAPFVIAYPNGDVDDGVAEVAREQGLRLGVTVAPGLNPAPVEAQTRMRLGRFRVVFDRREKARMRAVRSSVQLTAAARARVIGRG
jgi:peptidoglycan/xylan/chitin deacetylase (PgdA/CDA1 family)